MPEVESYIFTHKELIELMIKASSIHEGEWMLQVNFGLTAGNFGLSDGSYVPAGIITVDQLGLTRAKAGAPKSLVVNASDVNPRRST